MATFGVTEAMIEEQVFGLDVPIINDDNGPSSSSIATTITRQGNIVSGMIFVLNVDPDSLTTSDHAYWVAQELVLKRVLVDTLRGRDHSFELADKYEARADRLEDRLLKFASTLGNSQSNASGSPQIPRSHVNDKAAIEANRDDDWFTQSQADRKL